VMSPGGVSAEQPVAAKQSISTTTNRLHNGRPARIQNLLTANPFHVSPELPHDAQATYATEVRSHDGSQDQGLDSVCATLSMAQLATVLPRSPGAQLCISLHGPIRSRTTMTFGIGTDLR
jgi:hypothetical protein